MNLKKRVMGWREGQRWRPGRTGQLFPVGHPATLMFADLQKIQSAEGPSEDCSDLHGLEGWRGGLSLGSGCGPPNFNIWRKVKALTSHLQGCGPLGFASSL